jgi:hypothetical protein
MALVRMIKVLVKLPGNKTETLRDTIPADWVSGDKDAISEVLQNPKVRTKIAVVAEHIISVQIGDPYDPAEAGRVIRA